MVLTVIFNNGRGMFSSVEDRERNSVSGHSLELGRGRVRPVFIFLIVESLFLFQIKALVVVISINLLDE